MPNDPLNRRIGAAIARERERQGLTQTDVAKAIGIGQNTLSRYEAGERPLPIDTLEAVARALRVPVGSFLPAEELPADWRGAVALLDDLTSEDRAIVIEALIAMMTAFRRRLVVAPSSADRLAIVS